MAVRRLAPPDVQPSSFAFTAENAVWAGEQIAKYPEGRQASAVISLLWKAQEQCGGWLPEAAIRNIAELLGMAYIRVLEVATFYTMFNLEPVGKYFVQLCGTTPCMVRGAGALRDVLQARFGDQHHVSADSNFSWLEVECLGACCNAPMVQINNDYYEDLTPESLNTLLDNLAAGKPVKIGPQNKRTSSEPEAGLTSLTDPSLYDGSVIGSWKKRFEEEEAKAKAAAEEKAKAEAAAAAAEAAEVKEPAKSAGTRPEQQAADSPAERVAAGKAPLSAADKTKAAPANPPEESERAKDKGAAPADAAKPSDPDDKAKG
ncbi:MAG: NADH-quinone oxidoreductase subunit NuoE [Chelatococcus sp.]|jgi:NADH-quinone oxidoreductase subunit E|nr:NADH-quinone oxidoreductase subunit NuoE [Chelatococcus sp. HY11]MBX3537985.1 NADH-quinone oxidoreductase subunit NuoE [Chelatococcus sp.]MBX3543141.1 NADH-quinone oxidoreductase subunit NuoE [Chelatococcus sp.]CAH1673624.1 NADH-quinone oxidoreductase subunit E 1 [Hyphomicrobiales bacterium]CAH1674132.1 NADH-quinone oxidoreductase subunit E 1 [Hyphomicrobiales bacterium]